MKEIVTDLNDRERARFTLCFKMIQDSATQAIEALDKREDTKLLTAVVMILISTTSVRELAKVFEQAMSVDVDISEKVG